MEILTISGVEYLKKSDIITEELSTDYVIVRTYSAGVHAGYLKSKQRKEVVLQNTRRLWKWAGAFSLSEMALNGVTKPNECKFTVIIPEIILTEAIEIIPCSKKAKEIIESVKAVEL